MKIGHAHLKVRDLETASDFYQRALGLGVREQYENFAFLSATEVHHEVALQEVGPRAHTPDRFDTGLFHVAFEVPDKSTLAETYARLQRLGVRILSVDHRISWAIYFHDPDGNGLEVYCDTRADASGTELWEGLDRPLTPERLLAERR